MSLTFETTNLLKGRGEVVPANVPADALIFNAPRPIYGTTTWEGTCVRGIFFAAVNPDDPDRAFCVKQNHSLRAGILHFVSEEDARQMVRTKWAKLLDKLTPEIFEGRWRASFFNSFGQGEETLEA